MRIPNPALGRFYHPHSPRRPWSHIPPRIIVGQRRSTSAISSRIISITRSICGFPTTTIRSACEVASHVWAIRGITTVRSIRPTCRIPAVGSSNWTETMREIIQTKTTSLKIGILEISSGKCQTSDYFRWSRYRTSIYYMTNSSSQKRRFQSGEVYILYE